MGGIDEGNIKGEGEGGYLLDLNYNNGLWV